MKTVAFHTLGCKLNFADTGTLSGELTNFGFNRVAFNEAADVYVINTCSVTENADKECKTIVNRALAKNADAYVVVTGCFAQLQPNKIAKFEGVDLVIGAGDKFKLASILSNAYKTREQKVMACEIDTVNDFCATSTEEDKTRVYLKVQDGCNYNCSFCTIPLARGKSRSDSLDNVIQRAKDIANSGAKEIILTGINLGDFGLEGNTGKRFATFYDLLYRLDAEVDIPRIRISSIEPNLLSDEIIELVAYSNKIVPHFHIPLQSGSDAVLRNMKRRYKSDLFASRINKIKTLIPNCCIGADVITGFPGETDVDFVHTYEFLRSLPISYLHVFTYSERENTKAAEMDDAVELSKRKQRNRILRELSEEKQNSFYQSQCGKTLSVLFEKNNKGDFMFGYSDNYIRVKHAYDEQQCNQLVDCKIKSINNHLASASLLQTTLVEQY